MWVNPGFPESAGPYAHDYTEGAAEAPGWRIARWLEAGMGGFCAFAQKTRAKSFVSGENLCETHKFRVDTIRSRAAHDGAFRRRGCVARRQWAVQRVRVLRGEPNLKTPDGIRTRSCRASGPSFSAVEAAHTSTRASMTSARAALCFTRKTPAHRPFAGIGNSFQLGLMG